MSAYTRTVKNLKLGVLRKCGEPVDGSSIYDKNGDVLELLNRAHLAVIAAGNEFVPELARPWSWAVSPQKFILELQPPYLTGGVAATQGSVNITFDTPPTFSLQGYWLNITGYPEWFQIVSHVGGAGAAVIDAPFTEITGSGQAFLAIKTDYVVNPTAGVLRFAGPAIVYRIQDNEGDNEQKIYLTDETTMMKDWTMAGIIQRTPTRFCELTKVNSTGTSVSTIRFNAYPQYITKVEIPFVPFPQTLLDTPTYPFYATLTIASPGVFTYANNGLSSGDPVILSTTGALPTGFTIGTTYYVVSPTQNTFELSATVGGSAINTSGTQSGTITITPEQPPTYALVPADHVEILEYIAATWLCQIKNDDRWQLYEQKAVTAGKALIGAYAKERTESGKDRLTLIPRQDKYWANRRYVSQEVTPTGADL